MTVEELFDRVSRNFPPLKDETKGKGLSFMERVEYYNNLFMDMVYDVPDKEWNDSFHITKDEVIQKIHEIYTNIKFMLNSALKEGNMRVKNEERQEAKQIIGDYFFNRDSKLFMESKYTLLPTNSYYRIRPDDDMHKWEEFTQTSLFHISNKGNYKRNYRYSSNNLNYPFLYLTSSIYLSMLECHVDNFDKNFCIAEYLFSDDIKVLNFSYTNIAPFKLYDLYKIPFIFTSSFSVENEQKRNEYILPQLLMESFIEYNRNLMVQGNYEKFDGIRYQSAHSLNNQMYNIAFPALNCDNEDGYCNELAKRFKMTVPLHINIKDIKEEEVEFVIKEQLMYMSKDFIRGELKDVTSHSMLDLNKYKIKSFNEATEYFHQYFNMPEWVQKYLKEKREKFKGREFYSKFAIESIKIALRHLLEELDQIDSKSKLENFKFKYYNIFSVDNLEELSILKEKMREVIIE